MLRKTILIREHPVMFPASLGWFPHMRVPESPAMLVYKARKTSMLSQIAFAEKIGKTQSLVSKYERGKVVPPAQVIMHCMTILIRVPETGPSSTDIARLVENRLGGPGFAKLRTALAELIESVTLEIA